MDRLPLAACGIDCNECDIYKAAHDLQAAEALAKWFLRQGWIGESAGAEEVMQKAPCGGCLNKSGVHWSGDCYLLRCCEDQKLNHCGDCSEFPCGEYTRWASDYEHHQQAMEHLLSLRRKQ